MTDTISLLDDAYTSIIALCESLAPEDWTKPTDCPGWSVQDNLSHQTGLDAPAIGRRDPDHAAPPLDHVKRPSQERTEVAVDYRRSWPPDKVLAEFRDVASERIKQLRAAGDPNEFVSLRVFDCWMHEQDIRNAVGRPGHLEGPVVRHGLERCFRTIPMVVGKRVAPPDGTTIVITVRGPDGQTIALTMRDRRAVPIDEPPDPTVRITLDVHAFTRLGGGRQTPAQLHEHIRVDGDESLARKVLENLGFTP